MPKGVLPLLVRVRLNSTLPALFGRAHLSVHLADAATVADLIEHLAAQRPTARDSLTRAIPVRGGVAISLDQRLADGYEVALLMPMSGG